jgi:hypothetical protein
MQRLVYGNRFKILNYWNEERIIKKIKEQPVYDFMAIIQQFNDFRKVSEIIFLF